ncbi:MAG: phage terminase large subunit, partial [bacterium]|nr:phage terminase large subunit [bacterium]
DLMSKRAGRLAVAAPRGHAKSTIVSLAYVLWCVLYEHEKLVLLVSATAEQVVLLLKTIKDEIQQNSALLEDFPEICRPKGAPGQPKPWRNNRIMLPNGAMISAYGAGQGLRGAKNESHRPGLIIVDDIENSEQVIHEEQRHKLRQWFSGTLLHAGHPGTNVVVVGTVLHHDSLLANLVNPKDGRGWTGLIYKAVEQPSDRPDLWETWSAIFRGKEEHEGQVGTDAAEAFFELNRDEMLRGTRVLWPEREDYYALMVMREREGRASFQAEKQNEPIDPEVCIFSEQNFHYWDDEYRDVESLLDAVGRNGHFFGACDPSLGHRTRRGDYTAIVILYRPAKSKIKYLIAADIAKWTPDQAIERIIQFAKMYRFSAFAVEGNQFQELMIGNLRRRVKETDVSLPVYNIKSRANKQARIANLEPEITQGLIQLGRRHQLLLDQLRQFPFAVHDDGPDALEMAVATSQRMLIPEGIPKISIHIPPWARTNRSL